MAVPARKLLDQAAQKAPRSTVEAAAEALRASADPVAGAFLARTMHALARLATEIDAGALSDAAGAPSDYQVLLRAMQQPEALPALSPKPEDVTDELLARLSTRGLLEREQILQSDGGAVSAQGVARLLGISRQAVDKRRKAGTLIGLSQGRRGYAYPLWQFDRGRTLAGLEAVLAELGETSPWMRALFMLGHNVALDGERPLDELRRGHVEEVLRAARLYGEQGAP
jgi:hypothetical protein